MKKLRSPIRWFGGKGHMTAKLLKLVPPHRIYCEVFGGGASLLFTKTPSPVEVYNDLDSGLVNFFRVLRDPEKFKEFHRLASLTPYSREEYCFCRETWEQCESDVERAYRWYVVARMSFSGYFAESWSFTVAASCNHMSGAVSKWLSTIELLPEIHARFMRVQVEHNDFRKIIKTYDTLDTLFYLDPPYVPDTRKHGKYKNEMTEGDHKDLIDLILKVKGMVMLSGYKNPLYELLGQVSWTRYDYETACYAVARTKASKILGQGAALKMQPRTESVWLSPNCRWGGLFWG